MTGTMFIVRAFLVGWLAASPLIGWDWPPSFVAPDRGQARAVLTAVLISDREIRTLRWKQTFISDRGGPREWVVESTNLVDDQRRWKCHKHSGFVNPDTGKREVLDIELAFDGQQMFTLNHQSRGGLIREDNGDRYSSVLADRFLGRWLDRVGQQHVAEALLQAEDLALRWDDEGRAHVTGTALLHPLVAILELTVEPRHGWRLSRIVVRDAGHRVPYSTYEVTRFVQFQDIWLPSAGTYTSRFFDPPRDELERFGKALADKGIIGRPIDFLDPGVRHKHLAALREVWHADEAPAKLLVPPFELEIEYHAINVPVNPDDFRLVFPSDYSVYDGLRDLLRDGATGRWYPQRPVSALSEPR
ncbi:MAG TPA: hypothetical protein VD963_07295 [Phycisphaerales bacterium]|nr:hypothetical protein [Phycisphaerales bacterium]